MKLEKIEQSARHKGRCTLLFDNGRQLISGLSAVTDFNLYPGKEISVLEFERIQAAFSVGEIRKKALQILGNRVMSKKEITDRLVRKGALQKEAEDAALWLEEIGTIDDREYAAMAVRHYSAKGYGLMRIKNELYRRGVSRELWDDALREMPDNTDETIVRFIQMKLSGARPDRREKKKVSDALYRRGFTWAEINGGWSQYEDTLEDEA